MRFFTRLWQQVFLYSLILILASSAMGIYLVHDNLKNKASSVVLAFTAEVRNALEGQPPSEADAFLQRFNNQEARFWIEDKRGVLLAGHRFSGRTGKEWEAHLLNVRHERGVALWQTEFKNPLFLAITPCALKNRDAILYAAYMSFPVPPIETIISPGIVTIALITGLLALWMARQVSGPLRRLRREVAEISDPLRLRNVTVAGSDEIAEVARSVNQLVDSLNRHITGMNRLVLNISHELRSPITRMVLSAEMIGEGLALLQQERSDDPRRKAVVDLAEKNFEALRQELEHMDNLIGWALTYSKLDMRNPRDLQDRVSLSLLCENTAERYETVFRQGQLRFMRTIEDNIAVIGDATLLTQIISNLLDNAAKYAAGDERQIRLQLQSDGGSAVLSVENTHPPLPQEAIDHLFDAYFRHDQQTGTGVGLGLSIVQKIAALHSGAITASNTDTGVLLRVTLPLAAKHP